ncbi:Putative ATP-dependent DNA helicase YjcD [Thiorhodovibrio winogradskyi]|uniref:ATP-dependent DNA helicase YjcD n=1 Tax=Thiorhodovibrio winogradskyi TaxID=77007 RepID=A0ABZ0SGA7_9GAMM|nr:UvrD-helicase domain-containing protein [Thiorhodovibrio winogradskyi]
MNFRLLTYRGLDTDKIPGYAKLAGYLAAGDFRSAEVKKVGENLFRARLDKANRLLFALHRHQDEGCILLLEYIAAHAYEKSRFLSRGAVIDEAKIPDVDASAVDEAPELSYLNPELPRFHLLDKVLSFDQDQEAIYQQPPPLIVIGSAGSGKTALTLEKMKDAVGEVLYVTRSPFLVRNARELYYANGYENEDQEVDFLSFREYLETIRVPEGREMTPRAFAAWAGRKKLSRELRDTHRLFEEFQGALTGTDAERPYLDRETYKNLGVRQSIYAPELRDAVYDLFERYLRLLKDEGWFDANLVSHAWLELITPRYDFIVIDEVQDLTAVQLLLILRALRDPTAFLLCGDSNQIVHPNFFSWAKVKTLFWRERAEVTEGSAELIRILNANFRNSPQITEMANRLLHIKQARFGSVDRESNYLVQSRGPKTGRVGLLADSEAIKRDLDRRTAASARFAILVLHPDQKAEVRKHFRTPLVFSIHEAKGLEYENVLLYNFLSAEEKRYRDIAGDLAPEDLQGELRYARGRDKSDKSLEIFKFYINALYVAVTRAVRNLYLLETNPKQSLLELLGLTEVHQDVNDVEEQRSSLDDWRREAHRLELQGKEDQAAEIREQILKQREVPWTVLHGEALADIERKALEQGEKKARIALMEYALVYRDQRWLNALIDADFSAAKHPDKAMGMLEKKHYLAYGVKTTNGVMREVERYGVDFRNVFNQTPLMIASRQGHAELIEELLAQDADTSLVDANGLNAFQISLERACVDQRYARQKLPAVFERLAPPSLDIQVDGRLIKLDRRIMEYLMLCVAMVLFYQRVGQNWAHRNGLLAATDFEQILAHFPDSVIPERRKKRQYLSSILSKNEVAREGPGNRKLFMRVRRGEYLLNPYLSLRVEGRWQPIYQLLAPERLAAELMEVPDWYADEGRDPNGFFEREVARLRAILQQPDAETIADTIAAGLGARR